MTGKIEHLNIDQSFIVIQNHPVRDHEIDESSQVVTLSELSNSEITSDSLKLSDEKSKASTNSSFIDLGKSTILTFDDLNSQDLNCLNQEPKLNVTFHSPETVTSASISVTTTTFPVTTLPSPRLAIENESIALTQINQHTSGDQNVNKIPINSISSSVASQFPTNNIPVVSSTLKINAIVSDPISNSENISLCEPNLANSTVVPFPEKCTNQLVTTIDSTPSISSSFSATTLSTCHSSVSPVTLSISTSPAITFSTSEVTTIHSATSSTVNNSLPSSTHNMNIIPTITQQNNSVLPVTASSLLVQSIVPTISSTSLNNPIFTETSNSLFLNGNLDSANISTSLTTQRNLLGSNLNSSILPFGSVIPIDSSSNRTGTNIITLPSQTSHSIDLTKLPQQCLTNALPVSSCSSSLSSSCSSSPSQHLVMTSSFSVPNSVTLKNPITSDLDSSRATISTIASSSALPPYFPLTLSPINDKGEFLPVQVNFPDLPLVNLQVMALPGAKVGEHYTINVPRELILNGIDTALAKGATLNGGPIVLPITPSGVINVNTSVMTANIPSLVTASVPNFTSSTQPLTTTTSVLCTSSNGFLGINVPTTSLTIPATVASTCSPYTISTGTGGTTTTNIMNVRAPGIMVSPVLSQPGHVGGAKRMRAIAPKPSGVNVTSALGGKNSAGVSSIPKTGPKRQVLGSSVPGANIVSSSSISLASAGVTFVNVGAPSKLTPPLCKKVSLLPVNGGSSLVRSGRGRRKGVMQQAASTMFMTTSNPSVSTINPTVSSSLAFTSEGGAIGSLQSPLTLSQNTQSTIPPFFTTQPLLVSSASPHVSGSVLPSGPLHPGILFGGSLPNLPSAPLPGTVAPLVFQQALPLSNGCPQFSHSVFNSVPCTASMSSSTSCPLAVVRSLPSVSSTALFSAATQPTMASVDPNTGLITYYPSPCIPMNSPYVPVSSAPDPTSVDLSTIYSHPAHSTLNLLPTSQPGPMMYPIPNQSILPGQVMPTLFPSMSSLQTNTNAFPEQTFLQPFTTNLVDASCISSGELISSDASINQNNLTGQNTYFSSTNEITANNAHAFSTMPINNQIDQSKFLVPSNVCEVDDVTDDQNCLAKDDLISLAWHLTQMEVEYESNEQQDSEVARQVDEEGNAIFEDFLQSYTNQQSEFSFTTELSSATTVAGTAVSDLCNPSMMNPQVILLDNESAYTDTGVTNSTTEEQTGVENEESTGNADIDALLAAAAMVGAASGVGDAQSAVTVPASSVFVSVSGQTDAKPSEEPDIISVDDSNTTHSNVDVTCNNMSLIPVNSANLSPLHISTSNSGTEILTSKRHDDLLPSDLFKEFADQEVNNQFSSEVTDSMHDFDDNYEPTSLAAVLGCNPEDAANLESVFDQEASSYNDGGPVSDSFLHSLVGPSPTEDELNNERNDAVHIFDHNFSSPNESKTCSTDNEEINFHPRDNFSNDNLGMICNGTDETTTDSVTDSGHVHSLLHDSIPASDTSHFKLTGSSPSNSKSMNHFFEATSRRLNRVYRYASDIDDDFIGVNFSDAVGDYTTAEQFDEALMLLGPQPNSPASQTDNQMDTTIPVSVTDFVSHIEDKMQMSKCIVERKSPLFRSNVKLIESVSFVDTKCDPILSTSLVVESVPSPKLKELDFQEVDIPNFSPTVSLEDEGSNRILDNIDNSEPVPNSPKLLKSDDIDTISLGSAKSVSIDVPSESAYCNNNVEITDLSKEFTYNGGVSKSSEDLVQQNEPIFSKSPLQPSFPSIENINSRSPVESNLDIIHSLEQLPIQTGPLDVECIQSCEQFLSKNHKFVLPYRRCQSWSCFCGIHSSDHCSQPNKLRRSVSALSLDYFTEAVFPFSQDIKLLDLSSHQVQGSGSDFDQSANKNPLLSEESTCSNSLETALKVGSLNEHQLSVNTDEDVVSNISIFGVLASSSALVEAAVDLADDSDISPVKSSIEGLASLDRILKSCQRCSQQTLDNVQSSSSTTGSSMDNVLVSSSHTSKSSKISSCSVFSLGEKSPNHIAEVIKDHMIENIQDNQKINSPISASSLTESNEAVCLDLENSIQCRNFRSKRGRKRRFFPKKAVLSSDKSLSKQDLGSKKIISPGISSNETVNSLSATCLDEKLSQDDQSMSSLCIKKDNSNSFLLSLSTSRPHSFGFSPAHSTQLAIVPNPPIQPEFDRHLPHLNLTSEVPLFPEVNCDEDILIESDGPTSNCPPVDNPKRMVEVLENKVEDSNTVDSLPIVLKARKPHNSRKPTKRRRPNIPPAVPLKPPSNQLDSTSLSLTNSRITFGPLNPELLKKPEKLDEAPFARFMYDSRLPSFSNLRSKGSENLISPKNQSSSWSESTENVLLFNDHFRTGFQHDSPASSSSQCAFTRFSDDHKSNENASIVCARMSHATSVKTPDKSSNFHSDDKKFVNAESASPIPTTYKSVETPNNLAFSTPTYSPSFNLLNHNLFPGMSKATSPFPGITFPLSISTTTITTSITNTLAPSHSFGDRTSSTSNSLEKLFSTPVSPALSVNRVAGVTFGSFAGAAAFRATSFSALAAKVEKMGASFSGSSASENILENITSFADLAKVASSKTQPQTTVENDTKPEFLSSNGKSWFVHNSVEIDPSVLQPKPLFQVASNTVERTTLTEDKESIQTETNSSTVITDSNQFIVQNNDYLGSENKKSDLDIIHVPPDHVSSTKIYPKSLKRSKKRRKLSRGRSLCSQKTYKSATVSIQQPLESVSCVEEAFPTDFDQAVIVADAIETAALEKSDLPLCILTRLDPTTEALHSSLTPKSIEMESLICCAESPSCSQHSNSKLSELALSNDRFPEDAAIIIQCNNELSDIFTNESSDSFEQHIVQSNGIDHSNEKANLNKKLNSPNPNNSPNFVSESDINADAQINKLKSPGSNENIILNSSNNSSLKIESSLQDIMFCKSSNSNNLDLVDVNSSKPVELITGNESSLKSIFDVTTTTTTTTITTTSTTTTTNNIEEDNSASQICPPIRLHLNLKLAQINKHKSTKKKKRKKKHASIVESAIKSNNNNENNLTDLSPKCSSLSIRLINKVKIVKNFVQDEKKLIKQKRSRTKEHFNNLVNHSDHIQNVNNISVIKTNQVRTGEQSNELCSSRSVNDNNNDNNNTKLDVKNSKQLISTVRPIVTQTLTHFSSVSAKKIFSTARQERRSSYAQLARPWRQNLSTSPRKRAASSVLRTNRQRQSVLNSSFRPNNNASMASVNSTDSVPVNKPNNRPVTRSGNTVTKVLKRSKKMQSVTPSYSITSTFVDKNKKHNHGSEHSESPIRLIIRIGKCANSTIPDEKSTHHIMSPLSVQVPSEPSSSSAQVSNENNIIEQNVEINNTILDNQLNSREHDKILNDMSEFCIASEAETYMDPNQLQIHRLLNRALPINTELLSLYIPSPGRNDDDDDNDGGGGGITAHPVYESERRLISSSSSDHQSFRFSAHSSEHTTNLTPQVRCINDNANLKSTDEIKSFKHNKKESKRSNNRRSCNNNNNNNNNDNNNNNNSNNKQKSAKFPTSFTANYKQHISDSLYADQNLKSEISSHDTSSIVFEQSFDSNKTFQFSTISTSIDSSFTNSNRSDNLEHFSNIMDYDNQYPHTTTTTTPTTVTTNSATITNTTITTEIDNNHNNSKNNTKSFGSSTSQSSNHINESFSPYNHLDKPFIPDQDMLEWSNQSKERKSSYDLGDYVYSHQLGNHNNVHQPDQINAIFSSTSCDNLNYCTESKLFLSSNNSLHWNYNGLGTNGTNEPSLFGWS